MVGLEEILPQFLLWPQDRNKAKSSKLSHKSMEKSLFVASGSENPLYVFQEETKIRKTSVLWGAQLGGAMQ